MAAMSELRSTESEVSGETAAMRSAVFCSVLWAFCMPLKAALNTTLFYANGAVALATFRLIGGGSLHETYVGKFFLFRCDKTGELLHLLLLLPGDEAKQTQ